MKKLLLFSLFAFAILSGKVTTACTEPIDLSNSGMDPMLVITCILTDTTEFGRNIVNENEVFIGRTVDYFGQWQNVGITGAKVWLDSEPLTFRGSGFYRPQEGFTVVPGKTYTLEVQYDFDNDGVDEIYTATTTVPPKYKLDSISLAPLSFTSDYLALMMMYFNDSLGHKYFGAKLNNENDERFYSSRILRYACFELNDFTAGGIYRSIPLSSFEFYIRHEMNYDNKEFYRIYAGDSLMVQLEALSSEYYHYLEVAKTELSHNNPLFSAPRTNVPTNIKGGALGVFGSYTFSRAYVQVPKNTPGLPKRP